ncbi:MAG: hypothetical protein ACW98W_12640 [Candidatus Hodarchaeales archaeon]|jgi:hypothetical protein
MNIFSRGQSWQKYQELEDRIIDCFDYVALDKQHLLVYSNRFGELLLRIGSALDSLLSKARACKAFDNEEGIQSLRQKSHPTIEDYRHFYERYYQLSQVQVTVELDGVQFDTIHPFNTYKQNKNPNWWSAYNKVKHEWYDHLQTKGTFKNLLEALAGLFTINVLHKDAQDWLVEEGIINGDMSEFLPVFELQRINISEVSDLALKDALTKSRFGVPARVEAWANSHLFEHKFRQEKNIEYQF